MTSSFLSHCPTHKKHTSIYSLPCDTSAGRLEVLTGVEGCGGMFLSSDIAFWLCHFANSTGFTDALMLQAMCTGKSAHLSLQSILPLETQPNIKISNISLCSAFSGKSSTLPNRNPPPHLRGDCLRCNEIQCFHVKYSQLLPQLRCVLWCSKLM